MLLNHFLAYIVSLGFCFNTILDFEFLVDKFYEYFFFNSFQFSTEWMNVPSKWLWKYSVRQRMLK